MPVEIRMPKVDMVMESGELIEWLVAEGTQVNKGQPLFVIGTDKSAIEIEASASGILAGLSAKPGDVVPISQVIGYILEPGEALPAMPGGESPPASQPPNQAPGVPEPDKPEPLSATPPAPAPAGPRQIRATPLARLMAKENALPLADIPGSGPQGRIYRADVERFQAAQTHSAAAALPAAPSATQLALPIAGVQPAVYLSVDLDLSQATRLLQRVQLKNNDAPANPPPLSALVAYALTRCLLDHPALNSHWNGSEWIHSSSVQLGVRLEREEQPARWVLANAQVLRFADFTQQFSALLERTRQNTLQADEIGESTFTLSILESDAISGFTAPLNPPEAAVFSFVQAPITRLRGTLGIHPQAVQIAQAARFLEDLRNRLENPLLLI